jgi:hypothetical protein
MVAVAKGSSIMAEVQHVFGVQVDGRTYHARRAVYAVIRDSDGRIATVQAHRHLFLLAVVSKPMSLPNKPWCEKSRKNVPSDCTSLGKLAMHSNTFMLPLMISTLPCMQYSMQGRFWGTCQGKWHCRSSGYCQTTRRNFSMQVMSGQLSVFVKKETCHMHTHDPRDYLPDIRDGLTHRERIVLQCLADLQQERGGRNVPTGMLYGTVVEYIDMTVEEMQSILARLVGYQ